MQAKIISDIEMCIRLKTNSSNKKNQNAFLIITAMDESIGWSNGRSNESIG